MKFIIRSFLLLCIVSLFFIRASFSETLEVYHCSGSAWNRISVTEDDRSCLAEIAKGSHATVCNNYCYVRIFRGNCPTNANATSYTTISASARVFLKYKNNKLCTYFGRSNTSVSYGCATNNMHC
jgi:hypothetical protein